MFLDQLNWRYATKKMDPAKPVEQEKVDQILEAVRMAPTSSGLQPFKLFVITNKELRARLRAAARDQAQLTDGSHLLVFASWDNYTEERIDGVAELMAKERGGNEGLKTYYENLKAAYLPRDEAVNADHAARQAYIALGFAIAAAAELHVDCTPMEGFDNAQVDEILGLREKGLRSAVLLPLGYRQEDGDWLLHMKKVRLAPEDFFIKID